MCQIQPTSPSHSSPTPLLQGTVLCELPQSEPFPWAAVLHKLLQCGFLTKDAVLQDWISSALFLTGSQVLLENLLQHGLLSFQKLCQKPIPIWISQGIINLLWASTYTEVGHSRGCRWMSACLCGSMCYRTKSLSPWCALWAEQENLCSNIWNSFFHIFSLLPSLAEIFPEQ